MPIDFTAIVEAFKAAVPFIPVTLRLAFIPLFRWERGTSCSKFNGCLPTFLRLVRSSSH